LAQVSGSSDRGLAVISRDFAASHLFGAMRRVLRSTSSVLKKQSFDDIESLVTTLGVISALVFTFVIPLQYQASPSMTTLADFRSMLCRSQDFRDYVAEVMSWYDVGTHGFETFNFSVPTGAGKTFDIEQELKMGLQARHGEAKLTFMGVEHMDCIADPLVVSTAEVLFEDFPSKYVKVWIANHPEMHPESQETEKYVAASAAFSFSALVWSLILYISLALSPARESVAGERAWVRWGMWALMFGWLLLVMGCFTFLVGHNKFVIMQSPYPGPTKVFAFIIGMCVLTTPLAIVALLIAIYLFVISVKASKSEENEREEQRQLQAQEQGEAWRA